MALDPQRQRLDSLQQQEGAHRRQNGPGGSLVHAAAAGNVGGIPEMVGVDKTVIGRVRLAEHRETPRRALSTETCRYRR